MALYLFFWLLRCKLHASPPLTSASRLDEEEKLLIRHRGIITCALRISVFFTVPLFSDPTWYASGGPMIYALVEPSIYMIASILPTTRHLYRQVRRKAQRAAQLRNAKSDSSPKNSSSLSQSAELERIENSDTSSRGITRHVDIWQANTNSSQEELTLGKWYQNRQEWNQPRPADTSSPNTPKARSSASGGITRH